MSDASAVQALFHPSPLAPALSPQPLNPCRTNDSFAASRLASWLAVRLG